MFFYVQKKIGRTYHVLEQWSTWRWMLQLMKHLDTYANLREEK